MLRFCLHLAGCKPPLPTLVGSVKNDLRAAHLRGNCSSPERDRKPRPVRRAGGLRLLREGVLTVDAATIA